MFYIIAKTSSKEFRALKSSQTKLSVSGNLRIFEGAEEPTQKQMAALFAPTYADKRRAEYPAIGDQMDALWHAMDDGVLPKVEPFYSDIKGVKEKYPKQ